MKHQQSNDQEIAESLGLSLAEWIETKNGRKKKTQDNLSDGQRMTDEGKADLRASIAEFGKATNRTEQRFVQIQQTLKSILNKAVCVYIDETGSKVFFRLHPNNVVTVFPFQSLVSFATKELGKTEILISSKDLAEHIRTWSDKVETIQSFPTSFEIGGIDLTFNRIEISLEDGPTPTWDFFIAKCGVNGKALMAFVWALFEKKSNTQQYLLLKGSGRDGKGSFTRWLDRLHGGQTVGLDALNKYWPAMCVGKRIGIFNDITKTSVIMTSAFKQITGGDKITIEQKFEKAFSVQLETHFILTTNRSVNIIDEEAMRRRAILVEIESDDTFIEGYEEKLQSETSAFLFKCKRAYIELYNSTTRKIACDYSFFESESSSFEELNESLLKRCFVLDEKKMLDAADFRSRLEQEIGSDNNRIGSFKEWLERTRKIERKRVTDKNGDRKWVYPGLIAKPK